jgi:enoyl-CoA hydratase/carnithine racemase
MSLSRVERIVETANALNPDLILLLGDYAAGHRWVTRKIAIKEVVRETSHLTVQQAFDLVTRRKLKTVDTLYSSDDQKEGARAFAEKRPPVWKGR